jgi:hypothetical protein
MHLRAARTLIAALGAALFLTAAPAGAYTFDTPTTSEGDVLRFTFGVELGDVPGMFDPQEGPAPKATEEVDFEGEPVPPTPPNFADVPTIEDNVDEPDEKVKIVAPGGDEGIGTILDDDDPPALSVSDVSVPENEAADAKLTISAPNPSSTDIVIPLSVAGGADISVPESVTLPTLATSVDVPLTITNDAADEIDEQFPVRIDGVPAGATVADGEGVVTIVNDDLKIVDILDASTPEGDGGTSNLQFVIRLNGPTFRTVTVKFGTVDGNAKAPADYLGRAGTITFAPGQTTATLDVQVVGDERQEDSEVLGVWLVEITGAKLGDSIAVGVISDDDGEVPGGGGTGSGTGTGTGPGTGGGGTGTGTGGGTTEDASDVTPPQIRLGAPKASGRRVTMKVSCPSAERSCNGRITVFTVPDRRAKARTLRKERRVGAKSFRLRGGRSATVAITIPSSILKAARRSGRLKLQAFALTEDAADNLDTRTKRVTLRYRRPSG